MTADLPAERWRPIAGYEGAYEVSDQGRVRSLGRVMDGRRSDGRPYRAVTEERVLRPHCWSGYPRVSLCQEGSRRNFYVAALVAQAFVGERQARQIVIRRRGCRADTASDRLTYGGKPECEPIKRVLGRQTSCERNGRARLTPEQVTTALDRPDLSGAVLASRFGVHKSTINRIRQGESWKDHSAKPGCRPEATPRSHPDAPAVLPAGVSAPEAAQSRHLRSRPKPEPTDA